MKATNATTLPADPWPVNLVAPDFLLFDDEFEPDGDDDDEEDPEEEPDPELDPDPDVEAPVVPAG